jgi:lipoate-protein ligase A
MALDEALLLHAAAGGPPTLRFYEWSAPTLSLGYFQRSNNRNSHPPSLHSALVRRATGGGAILHDRELTYSITLPAIHPLARRAMDLYLAIHNALVATLATYGICAEIRNVKSEPKLSEAAPTAVFGCGSAVQDGKTRGEPFLCFQRHSKGDVLIDGWKIAGSAQRRHRGAVLQHGSILFGRSNAAPELPGIADLTGSSPPLDDFAARVRQALSDHTAVFFKFQTPSAEVVEHARRIEINKFANVDWQNMR